MPRYLYCACCFYNDLGLCHVAAVQNLVGFAEQIPVNSVDSILMSFVDKDIV